jgi:hypothetical protein
MLSRMVRPEDWHDFGADDHDKAPFESELSREVREGHELFGLALNVVSRRFAQDDILVTTPGRPEVASVHLTWTKGDEIPPRPRTNWHGSIEEAKDSLDDS